MRIIYICGYQEEADVRADMELSSIRAHTGLDTLGGLLVYNDTWHCMGDDSEARTEMGIEMKMLARDRGMYFNQPMIMQKAEELPEFLRLQIHRKGWEGNYLMVPAGWTFVNSVDITAIEKKLIEANYIHLPTPGDEASWTKENEAQEFEPIPEEGVGAPGPHFGRFEAFLAEAKTGHYVWSNNRAMKAVVKQAQV